MFLYLLNISLPFHFVYIALFGVAFLGLLGEADIVDVSIFLEMLLSSWLLHSYTLLVFHLKVLLC